MKNRLIVAGLLVLFSLGVCILEVFTINKVTKESEEILDSMLDKNKNKKQLTDLSSHLYEFWNSNMPIMAIFIQHKEIEEIEECLAIIKNSVPQGDNDTFHIETTRAKILLKNLKDTEYPYVENVF